MAVEYIVESLDKVETSIQSAYVARDGKFYLDPDKYADLHAKGLKAKNAELLNKVRGSLTAEERIASLESELKHYRLTAPLREMLGKVGILPDRFEDAFEIAQKYFRLEDSGEITVIDRRGNDLNMSPQKFFETKYMEMHPHFYEASKAAGSGAHNHNRVTGRSSQEMKREDFEKLSDQEKVSFSKAGGTLYD